MPVKSLGYQAEWTDCKQEQTIVSTYSEDETCKGPAASLLSKKVRGQATKTDNQLRRRNTAEQSRSSESSSIGNICCIFIVNYY